MDDLNLYEKIDYNQHIKSNLQKCSELYLSALSVFKTFYASLFFYTPEFWQFILFDISSQAQSGKQTIKMQMAIRRVSTDVHWL